MIRPPAPRPCESCPYRRNVPSGVWDDSEYAKLAGYDLETPFQPHAVFMCHQADGRVCAGWCGCHDMDESLALRLASARRIAADVIAAIRGYRSPVPLFDSGAEAAAHGRAALSDPDRDARRIIRKIVNRSRSETP